MTIVVPEEFQYLFDEAPAKGLVTIPDPVLRAKAPPMAKVGNKHRMLADNMIRVMKKGRGVGLAAPQVNVLERVVIVAPTGMKPLALFNPEVVLMEGSVVGEEGCLSIPGLYGDVERAEYIEVRALGRDGREVVFEMDGLAARVALHEIDHLDGILFIDKVDPATLHWMDPNQVSETE